MGRRILFERSGIVWRLRMTMLLVGVSLSVSVLGLSAPENGKEAGRRQYERLEDTKRQYLASLRTRDSAAIAENCYLLGKRHNAIGDYVTAKEWFTRCLRMIEGQGASTLAGRTYLRLAEHHIRKKQYEQAMQYAQKGLGNARAVGAKHGLMGAYVVVAGAFFLRYEQDKSQTDSGRDLDSANWYFRQGEKLALDLAVPFDIANLYLIYGSSRYQIQPERCLSYLKKADAIFSREKSTYAMINTRTALGKVYLNSGKTTQAAKWLARAQQIMDTSGLADFEQQGDLLRTSVRLYEKLSDYKQALASYKRYHAIDVAALTADREGAISRLEVEYETEKKARLVQVQRQELALRAKTLEAQRRFTWLTLIFGGAGVLAAGFFFWLFRKYRSISGQNRLLIAEQNHRVKNNLQQVTSLLALQSSRLTEQASKEALESSLLRVNAIALVHNKLYDQGQLASVDLQDYIPSLVLGVLQICGHESVKPVFELERIWLHVERAIPLGLILNELVTNSCKYAFTGQGAPGLRIACFRDGRKVIVEVDDGGPGFDLYTRRRTMGLQLIRELTETLKGVASTSADQFRLAFEG